MADTILPVPAVSHTDADPECDLVLLLGPDEVAIRVCSKVLSRASPVFATMLGPHFAEGQALKNSTAHGFPSIPLPEDDAEAMILLCRAIHFKLSVNEEIVSFEVCLKLASHCDKYDASAALGSWSEVLMKPWKDSFSGDYRYLGALYIARAFNNHRVFWSITRDVMRNYSAESVNDSDDFPKEMLPDRLLDAINNGRGLFLRDLQDTIEDIIAPYFNKTCKYSKAHRAHLETCGLLTISGYYFRELARLGFWPSSKLLLQTSPAHIAAELPKFEPYDLKDPEDRGYHQRNVDCMEPISVINCKELLTKAAGRAFDNQEGLCLSCLNVGKVTKEEGNCRAAEESKCTTLKESNR